MEADVVVYGGTSGGVVAAVAARRLGKTAVIVEPGRHLGGMTAGGLSWTDIGSKPEYVRALGYNETINGVQPPAKNPRAGRFEVAIEPL